MNFCHTTIAAETGGDNKHNRYLTWVQLGAWGCAPSRSQVQLQLGAINSLGHVRWLYPRFA
ncbi:hypothetical protein CsSME_00042126 [Camellia sinensis var. sinensis]